MEPADTLFAENVLPVNVPGLELRHRSVTPVDRANRGAHAEAALREIKAVTRTAPDAVMRHPFGMRDIDTTLQQHVLEQAANLVVYDCCHDRATHPEAATQPACDVVFATAFPNVEAPCRTNAAMARIEPQHDFT